MHTLKGLILSGGAGTRLRPITHTSAKQLVPVANRPVLFYAIDALVRGGVTEIGIVIAPETGDEIRETVGDGEAFGASITYITQDRPAGLAHAVLTAEPYLGSSPFVMYLGDNLLRNGIRDLVDSYNEDPCDASILLTPVSDPSSYGIAELDPDGNVVRLVEKPKNPPSNMALVGVYLFTPAIFDAARRLQPSWRGELEITEAIQNLIDDGLSVRSRVVEGWWKDTGQLADMLEANRLVLEDVKGNVPSDGDVAEGRIPGVNDTRLEGRIALGEGSTISRSVIRGPVVIGRNVQIEDAYIGPYTSIGDGVVVKSAEIENSIILEGSRVEDLGSRMEASLLGRNVQLRRSEGPPKALRMIVGDSSAIEIT